MASNENDPGTKRQQVESLRGNDLDQAFGESFMWLRKVARDPLFPRKIYTLEMEVLFAMMKINFFLKLVALPKMRWKHILFLLKV